MHRSFLIGDPDKDIDSRAVQMQPITDAVKGIASASTPVIAHRLAQRAGVVKPGDLYQGETSLHDLPGAAEKTFANTMVGPLAGEPLAGTPETAGERPAPIARPSAVSPAPAESPGIIGRAGQVALRRAGRIPGVQAVKDANYILRGPGESPAAPAPIAKPSAAPIPETEGIPWGSGGRGPLDLRGQRIPPTPKEPISEPPAIAKPNGKAASGDPIAKRLAGYMDRIQAEGHGDELPEPVEATPETTNLNTDLTPALKASLARVRAAKAARIARPN
jgi:hypothetical protein